MILDRRPPSAVTLDPRRAAILARMQWTVHGEEPLYQDEWLDIRIADVELPDGRPVGHRLIRTAPGAGCVVIRDAQVLLLWRHRFITGSWSWEIRRIEWMDLADVPAVIGRGEISSGTTVAALLYAITRQASGG